MEREKKIMLSNTTSKTEGLAIECQFEDINAKANLKSGVTQYP